MISRVRASADSFKPVEFTEHFNVVLADRTDGGSERKSTNGSGKTLLLEIIHFAFGADAGRTPLRDAQLAGWTFHVDATLQGREYGITRSVDEPARVYVEGDFDGWPIAPRRDEDTGTLSFSVADWTEALGSYVYGLPLGSEKSKFRPTFRTLLSYSIRRGRVFGEPFIILGVQPAWQKHVANAYFLGLDWTIYQRAHLLAERQTKLQDLATSVKKALSSGALGDFEGIGDLEARRINLEREVRQVEEQLRTFKVDPQYHDHERRASATTVEIHEKIAETVADRETLSFYQGTIEEETSVSPKDVQAMYDEAGLRFPEQVARQLAEAQAFHEQIVANRREYLGGEIARLTDRIALLETDVDALTAERARVLSFLRDHGALEDLAQLQILHKESVEELGNIAGQIEQLRSHEEALAAVKIEREQLKLTARADLDAKRDSWGRVVDLFGEFTAELYENPGQLIVDVDRDGGLKLDVDIERKKSQGVEEMTVLCYDLAVATAMTERGSGQRMLFHDSSVFDGVDPRQKATALRLAARQSEAASFQYVVCLNTGDVPWEGLDDFDLRQYERLSLSDTGEGGLLGIRY